MGQVGSSVAREQQARAGILYIYGGAALDRRAPGGDRHAWMLPWPVQISVDACSRNRYAVLLSRDENRLRIVA